MRRRSLINVVTLLAIGIVGGSIGCNGRVSQCGKLIERISSEEKSIDLSAHAAGKNNPKELAKTIDTARTNVRAVTISDAKLAGYQSDYARMLDALYAAMSSAGADAAANILPALDAAKKDETSVVDNVNAYCGGT